MSNPRYRRILLSVGALILALATTAAILRAAGWYFSIPRPISGPTIGGWEFSVVGMKGTLPVEMAHEWSGSVQRELQDLKGTKMGEDALRARVESSAKRPVVWADTGRARGSFRYYLTRADLAKANSVLDSGPPLSYEPRDVEMRVLEDDPAHQAQTLKLVISRDDSDLINVYRVENGRVHPLKWRNPRAGEMIPVAMLLPFVFVLSLLVWRWLLFRSWRKPTSAV